jgi:hypothetical protein|tara:strand:+ start:2458 stop:3966 length:1509 start_codon:yes stop_codon:yes gene_type:complete
MKKLAIIVPYRDRQKELDVFLPHIDSFLKDKNVNYQVIVIEQRDERPFNRGKLFNAAFDLIKDEFDYFCFHDVNLLPMVDECDYSYKEKPTHLASVIDDSYYPYEEFIGGVFIMTKEDFQKVNGFSNEYWGWGYEDNDLLERIKDKKVSTRKLIDMSSASKSQIFYDFTQVYLYNDFIPKKLNALSFTKNIHLELPTNKNIDTFTSKPFTISCWIKPQQTDYEQRIFCRPPKQFGISYTPENKIKVTFWQKETAKVIEQYREPNEWYNVVYTFDGTKIGLYINGSEIDTKDCVSTNNFEGEWFYFGSNSVFEENFIGQIADFLIFDKSLDTTDIRKLYMTDGNDLKKQAKLYYDFAKGYSSFILDSTDNDNKACYKKKINDNENLPIADGDDGIIKVGKKVKIKSLDFVKVEQQSFTIGTEIDICDRVDGEYKSIGNQDYVERIVTMLKSYDPDKLINSDIFYDEVRTKLLDTNEIGLSNLEYKKTQDKIYKKNHRWISVII